MWVDAVRETRVDALDLDHAVTMLRERTAERYGRLYTDPELDEKFEFLSSTAANINGINRWLDRLEAEQGRRLRAGRLNRQGASRARRGALRRRSRRARRSSRLIANHCAASSSPAGVEQRRGVGVPEPHGPGRDVGAVELRALQRDDRRLRLAAVAPGAGGDDRELDPLGRRQPLDVGSSASARARSGRPRPRSLSAMIGRYVGSPVIRRTARSSESAVA